MPAWMTLDPFIPVPLPPATLSARTTARAALGRHLRPPLRHATAAIAARTRAQCTSSDTLAVFGTGLDDLLSRSLLVISLTWHTTIASALPRRSAPLSRGGARVRRADSGFPGGGVREGHGGYYGNKQSRISTTDSIYDVPRTDALWNKLACPREPTGSLSEAI